MKKDVNIKEFINSRTNLYRGESNSASVKYIINSVIIETKQNNSMKLHI